jgi:hypothetical protein
LSGPLPWALQHVAARQAPARSLAGCWALAVELRWAA